MTFIRNRLVLLAVLPTIGAAGFARAQGADGRRATITGVVYDSIARAPLADAVVQLVQADSPTARAYVVASDERGRYTIPGIPDGRYRVGFFHPMLDSLTLEPILREVQVSGRRRMRVDLAIPSPARLREAICGPRARDDASAVIFGVVRDAADGARMSDVSVVAEWFEVAFTQRGVRRRMPRRESMTGEQGWFALCDLPTTGTMALRAARGADSTAVIRVDLPPDGFARRDLYLGGAASRRATVLNAVKPSER